MEFKTLTDLPPKSINHIMKEAWPAFMAPDFKTINFWKQISSKFPQLQIFLAEGDKVVGVVNMVPLIWNGDPNSLPDHWADIINMGITTDIKKANSLVAINIAVDFRYRRQGLSQRLIKRVKLLAKYFGDKYVLVPVRPYSKQQVPDMGINTYLSQKRRNGEPVDPWIRTHYRLGAKMIKIMPESIKIQAGLTRWHQWTAIDFDHDGQYDVPGALMPVKIDLNRGIGTYNDPGIWMKYEV